MSAGVYIWQGAKPCLKMLLTIGCGFTLAKKGLFPPAASKGFSQITMNIGLPALLFSSMVSSFNSENISNFGPLCLIAIIFQIIGLVMVLIIREIFYVPADFQWGVLMLGLISNWGNLPTAVVQSVAYEAPFNTATDPQLGIAYIAIFILIMNITFYGSGLYRVCGWDLRDDREEIPRSFSGRLARRKRQWRSMMRWISEKRHHEQDAASNSSDTGRAAPELPSEKEVDATMPDTPRPETKRRITISDGSKPVFETLQQRTTRRSEAENFSIGLSGPSGQPMIDLSQPLRRTLSMRSSRPTDAAQSTQPLSSKQDEIDEQDNESEDHDQRRHTWRKAILKSASGLMTPVTLGVILSLPFALVTPLKALFVSVPGWTGTRMPNAPDGRPPLAFFYDFTVFVSGITIPGGLILLGASFARLKISRERFKQMPIAAICAVTFVKLLVMPIIGVSIVIGFRNNTGLFPGNQRMLSFVAFLLSGTPSAVNQVVSTQIFAKEGQSLDTLASFLILQYALLMLQSSALTAISLWLVQK